MINKTQKQGSQNKFQNILKHYILPGIVGSAITLGAIGTYYSRQTPEYIRTSQLEQKAIKIRESLIKDRGLDFIIDQKDIKLTLYSLPAGSHGYYIGGIELATSDGIEYRSKYSITLNKGKSLRTLESVKIKTPAGSKTYDIKSMPEGQRFQKMYEDLLEKVYKEKIKDDQKADELLKNIGNESK
ncbi:MAG: hypothetical protein ACP5OG_04370 [Candidatus Nanoarchaeia archaeon]